MYPSYQPPAPPSPVSPTPREIKVISQRQYRANEGDCFNALREVIQELIGEELHTRQEIFKKALDLLLAASEIKKSREVKAVAVRPTSCEMQSLAENAAPVHGMGYAAGPSSWPPYWHSTVQSNVQPAYHLSQSSDGQQDHLTFNMDPALNHTCFPGYGEGWSNQFSP